MFAKICCFLPAFVNIKSKRNRRFCVILRWAVCKFRTMSSTGCNAVCRKYFGWLKHISVEPTMWLYMMAFMFTSVIEQDFFRYKACRVDHGYSEKECLKMNNEEIKTAVQVRSCKKYFLSKQLIQRKILYTHFRVYNWRTQYPLNCKIYENSNIRYFNFFTSIQFFETEWLLK